MSDGLELKSCPFCRGEACLLETGRGGLWFVRCRHCAAHTANYVTRREATVSWNRRALPDRKALISALSYIVPGAVEVFADVFDSGVSVDYETIADGILALLKKTTVEVEDAP